MFLIMIRAVILWIGSGVAIGTWTDNVEFVWSMSLAGVIGFLFSWAANRDWPHAWLRGDEEPTEESTAEPAKGFSGWLFNQKVALKQFCKKLKVTKKTAYPSEWFQLFNEDRRQYWVVLHLKTKERRLMGWVVAFPDRPESGHFILHRPKWLRKDGSNVDLSATVDRMLVSVCDVMRVEMLHQTDPNAIVAGTELPSEKSVADEPKEEQEVTNNCPCPEAVNESSESVQIA